MVMFNLTPQLKGGLFASPLTDVHKNYQCNFSLIWAWSMLHSLKGQVKCSQPPIQTTTETKDIDCHEHPHPHLRDVQDLGQQSICKVQVLSVSYHFRHQHCAAVCRLTKIKI